MQSPLSLPFCQSVVSARVYLTSHVPALDSEHEQTRLRMECALLLEKCYYSVCCMKGSLWQPNKSLQELHPSTLNTQIDLLVRLILR